MIQKAAHRLGLHIGRFPPVDSLAYHLTVVFRELAITCVIDVGAHTGEYGKFLRALGYRGQIVSFEPVRSTFETLSAVAAEDGNWRVENVALGPNEGEMEINICKGSVFNSFLPPTDNWTDRFRSETQVMTTERVRVRPLASVIDEILATRRFSNLFVKMDTQGYDLEVIKSAGDRLRHVSAIQTELAARPTYQGMPSLAEALTNLGGLGFEITGMFPVAREMDHLRVIEFDCVMSRGPRRDAA